jgi:hypothetical protein
MSFTLDNRSNDSSDRPGQAWSIPQPELKRITPEQAAACKKEANLRLKDLQVKFRKALEVTDKLECANSFSEALASEIVSLVGSIVGMKRATHKKGKYQTTEITKARAEITTISKARDLIRSLYFDEFLSDEARSGTTTHLRVLLDRLCRMGLPIPVASDIASLHEWSESMAPYHIKNISTYLSRQRSDLISIEKQKDRETFLDCKRRGAWLEKNFGSKALGCPNFAFDPKSGSITTNPGEVKRIYLEEGAQFLRNKLECPPEFKEEEEIKPEPPPDLKTRSALCNPKVKMLPRWWKRMYNRDAKEINADIWDPLMKAVTWPEVLKTISEAEQGKAAGYDGVSCDLVRLLCEDSKEDPTPCLALLTSMINVAFEMGQTLKSWRKAIITMIPKKKEDGSFTSLVSEMRPISVLQEFGKISSKILSNRLGCLLLKYPYVMNEAQRAFLKDGCTAQCINIALNVLEDFKGKKKLNPKCQLYLVAYDQVKAYDTVQAYSIRASLERFNLPAGFIEYVLSNLESATSCFKTYYGPTNDIAVEASVRQGDPLSPLVYICVTDALHEGFRRNPLYNLKTGYSFSNDPLLVIASTGYADDTMTYCESWSQQWMMHEWMRDFCFAHGFQINAKKSRYVISDREGPNDSRWLSSVDGKDRITPLASSEQIRYLGLWLCMDLIWDKQIQVMNKYIMDWRWKVFAAKVDAAHLKSSILEYLLPRMEIGLAHADITKTMCDAWLST